MNAWKSIQINRIHCKWRPSSSIGMCPVSRVFIILTYTTIVIELFLFSSKAWWSRSFRLYLNVQQWRRCWAEYSAALALCIVRFEWLARWWPRTHDGEHWKPGATVGHGFWADISAAAEAIVRLPWEKTKRRSAAHLASKFAPAIGPICVPVRQSIVCGWAIDINKMMT